MPPPPPDSDCAPPAIKSAHDQMEASAGKPPLTDEQRAKRDAEKESDMRIMCELLARAQTLEEKWASEDSGNKRARSDDPMSGVLPTPLGAANCEAIIEMTADIMKEAGIEECRDAWLEISDAMKRRGYKERAAAE